ncbi:hypothetical protein LJB91_00635 [Bacteroidales bacterium OttesenSCG-928-L03]|nr:hypothetical protein [Bacteroidales bacterium OttesenSCG-928-L03]
MKISPKAQWIGSLCLLTGFVCPISAILMTYVFKEDALAIGICCAIAFFFVYELCTVIVLENKRSKLSAKQMVNLYLGLKVGKILLSLILVTIYAVVAKLELKRFVLVFVALYLVYLLFDTLYLTRREKEMKDNERK